MRTLVVDHPLEVARRVGADLAVRSDRLAPGERATGGFTLVGVDVAWRMSWANGNILWFVRGANLLDEEMRRHASPLKDIAPLAARHFAAGMTIEF